MTGTDADKLNQLYQVRVAETRDTAVAYLRCMRFDLVVIDHTIADDIAAAITKEASPGTAAYFPKRSGKTLTMVLAFVKTNCKDVSFFGFGLLTLQLPANFVHDTLLFTGNLRNAR